MVTWKQSEDETGICGQLFSRSNIMVTSKITFILLDSIRISALHRNISKNLGRREFGLAVKTSFQCAYVHFPALFWTPASCEHTSPVGDDARSWVIAMRMADTDGVLNSRGQPGTEPAMTGTQGVNQHAHILSLSNKYKQIILNLIEKMELNI